MGKRYFDPKVLARLEKGKKYLIQDGNPVPYVWSEKLAMRKDMRAYIHGEDLPEDIESGGKPPVLVPFEIGDKKFYIDPELYAILKADKDLMDFKQAQDEIKAEKIALEALRERLTTDNQDLAEQLKEANERIEILMNPGEDAEQLKEAEEFPIPKKRGRPTKE